jgi:hypothetical protein
MNVTMPHAGTGRPSSRYGRYRQPRAPAIRRASYSGYFVELANSDAFRKDVYVVSESNQTSENQSLALESAAR